MSVLIGQSIGRYHITEQLGQGGMATVYKAFDTRLERDVAVKFIRSEKLDGKSAETVIKRFKREAQALAKLSHPNILTVLDYGEHEGHLYLVTEFMPGGTLKEKIGKQIHWADAAKLLAPIARALEYAHAQGIIHRDIKPANILISPSGLPVLADFGIAKILESDLTSDLTGTNVGVGTPDYMAPEQGLGKNVDHRADVYALGIVFYEMITGRKPYAADTPLAVMMKQASEPLPRPKEYVLDLPDVVEKIIFKAVAKKPQDRFQDMTAFATALEKLFSQISPESRPIQISKKAWIASAVGVFVLIALAVFWTQMQSPLASPITPTPIAQSASTVMPTLTTQPVSTGASSTAVFTPTFKASPTISDSLPYDDFNDVIYDGKFNANLWLLQTDPSLNSVQIFQKDGLLNLISSGKSKSEWGNLVIRSPWNDFTLTTLKQPIFMEAKIIISKDTKGGDGHVAINLSSNQDGWSTVCAVSTNKSGCFAFGQKEEFSYNFGYGVKTIQDRWYTMRIELEPSTMTLSYYRDGELLGARKLVNSDTLKKSHFAFNVGVWQPDTTQVLGKVDDVRVGIVSK